MDTAFLKQLLELGSNVAAVAAAAVPGATEAVAAARSAIGLITRAKEMFEDGDQPDIERVLNELAASVNAHADDTIETLRGS